MIVVSIRPFIESLLDLTADISNSKESIFLILESTFLGLNVKYPNTNMLTTIKT